MTPPTAGKSTSYRDIIKKEEFSPFIAHTSILDNEGNIIAINESKSIKNIALTIRKVLEGKIAWEKF